MSINWPIGMMLHDIVMLYQDLKKKMQCAFIKKNIAKKKESIDVKKKLIMGYLKKKIKNNLIIKPVFLLKVMKDERQLQLLHQYL